MTRARFDYLKADSERECVASCGTDSNNNPYIYRV